MRRGLAVASLLLALASLVVGQASVPSYVGVVKVARGSTWVERSGVRQVVVVGFKVLVSDISATGSDGSLGITFLDESLLAIGPNSRLGIENYTYDPVTQRGTFNVYLLSGTMSVSSGRIAQTTPGAMQVRTAHSAVRLKSTEFLVRAGAL